MTVIGLTGWGGAGKSTVAQMLVEDHGFTRVSFAAPLKNMLRKLDPIITTDGQRLSDIWDLHQGDERHIKTWYPEYQRLLRTLGTDCIRAEMDDFWTVLASNQVEDLDGKYVFDDCRFPNEARLIKYYNPDGLWHVFRGGVDRPSSHESEQHAGQLGETFFLGNDSTLDVLRRNIGLALEEMRASA